MADGSPQIGREGAEKRPGERVLGVQVLAAALASQGARRVYGVVGIPILELAMAVQGEGVGWVGMRHEAAASYAGGCEGFLTGRPGVCAVVSGPGVTHALAGLANAAANCWPLVVLGGACDTHHEGAGGFQEPPGGRTQVEIVRPHVKWAARPDSVRRLPFFVERAFREAVSGRPGPVFLDLPADLLMGETAEGGVVYPPRAVAPPGPVAPAPLLREAVKVLQAAERPLVIVGKGAAYGRAEDEVRRLIKAANVPFLATPMGKGVVPDDDEHSAAAARSFVLRNADVVVLLGARLNWMLHFGMPPRWVKDVKIIQVDICPEEIGSNVAACVGIVGDVKSVAGQLATAMEKEGPLAPDDTSWRREIAKKTADNGRVVQAMMDHVEGPLSYYNVFKALRNVLPRDAIIVSEGANTMDIGRTLLPNYFPRHRIDAGTFGTMGVGLGFAIAAAMLHPEKKVVAVEGDSAFGFSGMEVETACRMKLPICFVVVNNNGIYQGVEELPDDEREFAPATALMPAARYDQVVVAFGGTGYFVRTEEELKTALASAMADKVPSLVNVMIDTTGQRKPQEFGWLTKSKI